MDMKVIKPNREGKDGNNSILTPIIYLILGVILAFFNNQVVQLIFYIIGLLVIVYGIKSFIVYYQTKDTSQYKNISLGVAIVSIIIGILLIILSDALQISIRYVIGFFLLYMGISRLLMQVGTGDFKGIATISNILLVIMGIFSIFKSNVFLMIVGWMLILNAIILLYDYIKKGK